VPAASSAVDRVAAIAPGGFAAVMATGIVAIAALMLGEDSIAWLLAIANIALYPAMCIAMGMRLAITPRSVVDEFASFDRGPGFLAIVAATCVLGSQCGAFGIATTILPALLAVAAVLWALMVYGLLAALTLRPEKPLLQNSLSGSWLLIVVATEALAVLGSYVAPLVAEPRPVVLTSLAALLLGGAFYPYWRRSSSTGSPFFRCRPTMSRRRGGSTWAPWRSRRSPAVASRYCRSWPCRAVC
jgi:hypothetical protein